MRNASVDIPIHQPSVWVRLNEAGEMAYKQFKAEQGVRYPAPPNRDGRLKFSMTDLMRIFGRMMRDGLNPFREDIATIDLPV